MEAMELFYPQVSIEIGGCIFDGNVRFEVCSSKSSYFDWAKVCFAEEQRSLLKVKKGDPAKISLGYSGVLEDTFVGYSVQTFDADRGAAEILLRDDMLRLEGTIVGGTFTDTTPQEVLSYLLKAAGITKAKLSSKPYQEHKRFVLRRMNVVNAIHAVHSAWGIRQSFFFSDGTFYWGERPIQEKIYTFEYGVNILSLSRFGGTWELETALAPFVHHSHKVNIIHPEISGEFEVQKVITGTNEDGFIRTKIFF